jgi:hypothetical protein
MNGERPASDPTERALVPGLLLTACVLACGGASLDAEVRDLQSRTLPAGARLLAGSPITRGEWSYEAAWEVEAATSWDDYLRQVRHRLAGFTSAPGVSGAAQFTRTLPGDTHTLRVEMLSAGPPLRVRVIFRSLAS